MLDAVVHRKQMKGYIARALDSWCTQRKAAVPISILYSAKPPLFARLPHSLCVLTLKCGFLETLPRQLKLVPDC